jgi:hypothetical protein
VMIFWSVDHDAPCKTEQRSVLNTEH